MESGCPFCTPDPELLFHESELMVGLWDRYPVSPGHALLVPRRHFAGWFDASLDEQQALVSALEGAKREIEKTHEPDGYNIGVNSGEAAGHFNCRRPDKVIDVRQTRKIPEAAFESYIPIRLGSGQTKNPMGLSDYERSCRRSPNRIKRGGSPGTSRQANLNLARVGTGPDTLPIGFPSGPRTTACSGSW